MPPGLAATVNVWPWIGAASILLILALAWSLVSWTTMQARLLIVGNVQPVQNGTDKAD